MKKIILALLLLAGLWLACTIDKQAEEQAAEEYAIQEEIEQVEQAHFIK